MSRLFESHFRHTSDTGSVDLYRFLSDSDIFCVCVFFLQLLNSALCIGDCGICRLRFFTYITQLEYGTS